MMKVQQHQKIGMDIWRTALKNGTGLLRFWEDWWNVECDDKARRLKETQSCMAIKQKHPE